MFVIILCNDRYLVRPSPFSAQKTFERHNSRRKSNISFCSQTFVQQMGNLGSRRGSTIGPPTVQPNRAPPLGSTKANSLSLPDSPTVPAYQRGRSNSLRVIDDILLRRSNSLRHGLSSIGSGRRKSSLEDIGLSHFSSSSAYNSRKIPLNNSIGLEVTPPEENSPPVIASNTSLSDACSFMPMSLSKVGSATSLSQGLPTASQLLHLGVSVPDPGAHEFGASSQQSDYSFLEPGIPSQQSGLPPTSTTDPQHLQGTIV